LAIHKNETNFDKKVAKTVVSSVKLKIKNKLYEKQNKEINAPRSKKNQNAQGFALQKRNE
jgi:hypothetical protein